MARVLKGWNLKLQLKMELPPSNIRKLISLELWALQWSGLLFSGVYIIFIRAFIYRISFLQMIEK